MMKIWKNNCFLEKLKTRNYNFYKISIVGLALSNKI